MYDVFITYASEDKRLGTTEQRSLKNVDDISYDAQFVTFAYSDYSAIYINTSRIFEMHVQKKDTKNSSN